MNQDLTILTFSTHEPEDTKLCYPQFLASCRRHGYEPVNAVLSRDQYGGLGSRPRIIQQAIREGRVPTKYMLFSDAWDVVFAQDPDDVLDWYHGFHNPTAKIVWNAERNCFPDAWQADRHPEAPSGFRYLNSGFAIGETAAFEEALRQMHAEHISNDYLGHDGKRVEPCCQAHWMASMLNGPVPMGLDTNCEMALTMHGMDICDLDLSGDRIRHIPTGSYPMAFHGNGDARNRPALAAVIRKLRL